MSVNIITTVEMVMPDKAKEYLATMGRNRPISSRDVDKWCRIIRNGDFKTTHQGIAFNARGELIDGQHRLTACAMTNIPITVCVTRGLEDDTMTAIDIGKTRSIRDVVSITSMGEHPMWRNASTIGMVRGIIVYGFNQNYRATPSDIERVGTAYAKECEIVYRAAITKKRNKPTKVMYSAALAALMCGEQESDIHEFFDAFCYYEASGNHNNQMAFSLSKIVQDSLVKHTNIKSTHLYNLTQNAIWHFCHNTKSSRLTETKEPRYDVKQMLGKVLKGE